MQSRRGYERVLKKMYQARSDSQDKKGRLRKRVNEPDRASKLNAEPGASLRFQSDGQDGGIIDEHQSMMQEAEVRGRREQLELRAGRS